MGQKYLIDTNVVSHLFAGSLSDAGKEFVKNIVDADFIISVVVEIEALSYHGTPNEMTLIEGFVSLATILPLDKEVAGKAILLRRKRRKLKLGDAIIGATALVHNLVLVTNNVKDFANIQGLQVVDPHNL